MAFAKLDDRARAWELLDMINPVNHGSSPHSIEIYKVEPYVMAADVYAVSPHIGRGGWTWYTGSSGWMYRLIVESLLGLKLEGDKLSITPCLPEAWNQFKLTYRYKQTTYHITVTQKQGVRTYAEVFVAGIKQDMPRISMVEDGQEHVVEVVIGADLLA